MGVKGLWRLLMPIGRRISIETLEGRILAIDASIWLTQFLTVAARQRDLQDQDGDSGFAAAAGGCGGGGGRNYDYLVGFLRRLCKLRYHGIRPVLVFDGATPEIKQRELRARRKRQKRKRESFLADNYSSSGGGDANDGGADDDEAIRRMAKRILVQQLKKIKDGSKSKMKGIKSLSIKTSVTGGVGGGAATIPGNINSTSNGTSMGSEAPGFYNPDAAAGPQHAEDESTAPPPLPKPPSSSAMAHQEMIELLEDDDYLQDADDGINGQRGSDWDVVGVVENQDRDGGTNKNSHQRGNSSSFVSSSYSTTVFHKGDGTQFDVDQVAALASSQRKDVAEDAQRSRRLQSRREFLKVAYDPEGLSQCQLRNFLKSSQLNKDIAQMAKRATKKEEEDIGDGSDDDDDDDDELLKSNNKFKKRTKKKRRIIFEKYSSDNPTKPTARDKEEQLRRYRDQKLSLLYDEKKNDDEDPTDGDDGNDSEDDEGNLDWGNDLKASFHYATSQRAFEDDDDDDDDDEKGSDEEKEPPQDTGGGFFSSEVASPAKSKTSIKATPVYPYARKDRSETKKSARRFQIQDDDDDDDNDEVEFLDTKPAAKDNAKALQELQDEQLARALQEAAEDDEEQVESGAGFFQPDTTTPSDVARIRVGPATGGTIDILDSDTDDVKNSTSFVKTNQEHEDEKLAKSLQEAEYEDGQSIGDGRCSPEVKGAADGVVMNAAISSKATLTVKKRPPMVIDAVTTVENVASGKESDGEEEEDEEIAWVDGDEDNVASTAVMPRNVGETATDKYQTSDGSRAKSGVNFLLPKENPEAIKEIGDPKNTRPASSTIQEAGDDDDVDWEDGDGNEAKAESSGIKERQLDSTKNENIQQQKNAPIQMHENGDDGLNDLEVVEETLKTERDSDLGFFQQNDWGDIGAIPSHSKKALKSEEMAAALEHAQATAANRTDWAGRAFRRAVAQHAEENGMAVPETAKPKAVQIRESSPPVDKSSQEEQDEQLSRALQDSEKASSTMGLPPSRNRNSTTTVDNFEWFQSVASHATTEALEDDDGVWQAPEPVISVGSSDPFGSGGITDEMREDVMQLLTLFGVPYVVAPAEAEAQCVTLEQLGLVDGIVTEDCDTFVFGGQVVYRNIFNDLKYVEVYHSKDASEEMNLTRDALVALAMLLGGDYTEGVKGVGIVNGMEILQAFDVAEDCKSGLTRFRKWLDGFDPANDLAKKKKKTDDDNDNDDELGSADDALSKERIFHKKHHSARTRWIASKTFPDPKVLTAYLNPVVDTSRDEFSWGTPNVDGLVEFCRKQMGWTPEDTRRLVQPVVDKMGRDKGMHQTRMDSFMRYEDSIKFASIRSQRLKDVLSGVQSGKKKGRQSKATGTKGGEKE